MALFGNVNSGNNTSGIRNTQNTVRPQNISRNQIGSAQYDALFKQYDLDGDGRLNTNNKNGMNEIDMLAKAYEQSLAQASGDNSQVNSDFNNFYNSVNNFAQNGDTSKVYRDGQEISANGKLDDQVKQGQTGDCWLLSQLNSLNDTDYGKEAIKDAIHKNDNGSYTVDLKGVNESYTFTPDEIQSAIDSGNYASGDLDAALLEMACEKHYDAARTKEAEKLASEGYSQDEIKNLLDSGKKSIEGGNGGSDIADMNPAPGSFYDKNISGLLGIDAEHYSPLDNNESREAALKLKSDNGDKYATTFGSSYDVESKQRFEDGGLHEYSIKSVDKDANGNISTVNVIDPHDNSRTIPLTLDEYNKMADNTMTISSADPTGKAKINDLKNQDNETLTSRGANNMLDGNKSWDDCFDYLIDNRVDKQSYINQCGGLKNFSELYNDKIYDNNERTNLNRAAYECLGFSETDALDLAQNPKKMAYYSQKYGYQY